MSKSKISGKLLSIQLSRSEMQIVLVDKGTEILHSVCVPMPSGAVDDGMIRNVEAVTEVLKAAVKTPELKRVRQAVFSLCTTQVITETVTTPELTGKKLAKLLHANMDMYFPVDVQDYRLVWQVIGPKYSEGGLKEQAVQLWAVPNAMVSRYYTVANACGLSVAAIDYCGNSVATVIGASYSKNTKAAKQRKKLDLNQEITFGKKGKFEAAEVQEPIMVGRRNPDTDLHILLEKDLLGMTFVQNGQIVLQRFIRRSPYTSYQFGELSMMLEYFRAMDIGRGSDIRGIVSGADARNDQMVAELAETLDIPVTEMAAYYAPELCLCMGAARTNMEFGIPTLNSITTGRQQLQGHLWQYALVLAGALAVLMVGMHLLQSRLGWDAEVSRLNNSYQTLAIQHQQTAGYADNYRSYKSAYDAYSADWNAIFENVRLQNDNLVLMLQELEEIVPENASVTNMSIKPTYMQVSFACKTKEEAAYLIMSLRDMKYADPNQMQVSDLKGGGKGAAKTYGNNYADEAPPVEGGSDEKLNPAGMSKREFVDQVVGLTTAQQNTLKSTYGQTPSTGYSYDDLLNHESGKFDEARIPAVTEMLNYDPFAMVIFADLLRADYEACGQKIDTTKSVFIKHIEDDLWLYALNHGGMPEDLEDARELLDVILNAVAKNDDYSNSYDKVTALEDLFRTSGYLDAECREYMEKAYCHYLAVKMGVEPEEKFPFLNKEKIIADGGFKTGDAAIDALTSLIPTGETEPTPSEPGETEPDETEPDATEPGGNAGSENAMKMLVGMALDAYMETGTADYYSKLVGIDIDAIIGAYLAGKSGEYDELIDAYIEDGDADEALEELLYKSIRYPSEVPNTSAIQNLLDKIENGDKIREPLDSAIMRCSANVTKRIKKELDKEKENNKESTTETTSKETAAASSQPSSPYADGRIHFTVTLGYNQELLNAELNRRGLSYGDKILELEVAE